MDLTIKGERNQHERMAEDAELVGAAQRNPLEFEALYRKWLTPVYRYFYFRLGNVKDAEDLTAQVFLKAYQDLPRYRNRGAFSAWLFTIAHARLVDYYRKNSRKAALEVPIEELEIPVSAMDLPERAAQKGEFEQVFSLLMGLTEKEQTLIRLRFMAELSYREIGQVLHCKEDTARKSVARLLERMKKQMENDHD
ncbi:RNA polymerase sigma factor [Pelolinea submarina]|uniref:RNA polymerase sigma-70 factor (ECF subfamily) n=1 Tax=Pelolinea submarina TaxID=913107 RepID=A0A347ZUU6_9CHLR|nr:RNA polymerase sigma factor [Pelolinea submarina]REG10339.1 RNA polymerase sigma-70 factor (ECF subfamily) [Pelolinea submarina]BBB49077.1 RNA polymerase sigma-70 factor, ECF subfamily [Pelolinea submarina]